LKDEGLGKKKKNPEKKEKWGIGQQENVVDTLHLCTQ